jgi:hypothetical protein
MSSIQNITEQFKGLSAEELLTIIAAATAEAKKSVKLVSKAPKEAKEKKGSMPKGSVPPQLVKPRAWVNSTLDHANMFGWESFEVKGQSEPMPASVLVDGKHVFEATGKPMNNKQAMSLSKVRWDRKAGKGTREDLYKEFEASETWKVAPAPKVLSVAPEESASAACSVAASVACSMSEVERVELAPPEVKKSAVDKNREKAEAALKKAQEKETEALRKKAEALRKKEETAAAKLVAKPPATKPKKAAAEKAEAKEVVPAFDHEDDGFAHPWDFKGKKFLRDYEGNMWLRTADGESAGWAGKFDRATNSIDTSAEEPELEDD